MKIPYYLSLVAVLGAFATSCSNKYETAIADYVQTIEGTKVDLGFEMKDAKEVKQITVADSISILNMEIETETKNEINKAETEITIYQKNLVAEQTASGVKNKTIIDALVKTIDLRQAQLDSLKAVKPAPITKYEGRKATDVLAIVVEAKYTVANPLLDNAKTELTNQFVLTPDAKKCLAQIAVTAQPEEQTK